MKIAFHSKHHYAYRLLEVAVLSLVTSALTFTLPIIFSYFSCKDILPDSPSPDQASDFWFAKHGLVQESSGNFGSRFNCGVNQTNELASVFFGSREEAIKNILKVSVRV